MRLFLLFLIIPLIEIALFIQVGGTIGLGWTLGLVVLSAVLGAVLVRSQGLVVLSRLGSSMSEYRDPTEPLAHGAMILLSGALLLTPGFFTDAVGVALLVPGVRDVIFGAIRKRIAAQGAWHEKARSYPAESDVVDAEYNVLDASDGRKRPSGWTRH